jgi:hypothetical protein
LIRLARRAGPQPPVPEKIVCDLMGMDMSVSQVTRFFFFRVLKLPRV